VPPVIELINSGAWTVLAKEGDLQTDFAQVKFGQRLMNKPVVFQPRRQMGNWTFSVTLMRM
jgi:hypothetical protein